MHRRPHSPTPPRPTDSGVGIPRGSPHQCLIRRAIGRTAGRPLDARGESSGAGAPICSEPQNHVCKGQRGHWALKTTELMALVQTVLFPQRRRCFLFANASLISSRTYMLCVYRRGLHTRLPCRTAPAALRGSLQLPLHAGDCAQVWSTSLGPFSSPAPACALMKHCQCGEEGERPALRPCRARRAHTEALWRKERMWQQNK